MKKRTKKLIIILLVFFIILGFVIVKFIKSNNMFTSDSAGGILKSFNDNEISFNVGSFNEYVNIGIKYNDGVNIENPLKVKILDSNDRLVDEFNLNEDEIAKKSYQAKKGEWKFIINFEKENQEATIKYSYKINSTKDNDVKFE